MLHPHLYFVSFVLSGAILGLSLCLPAPPSNVAPMAGVAAAVRSYVVGLFAPFCLGFGAAGVLSEGFGVSPWPGSLAYAGAAGMALMLLNLIASLVRGALLSRRALAQHAGGIDPPIPGVAQPVEPRDDAGADQHE
ncbi:MAG: hypothetical protein RL385_1257 [Pseudomonadota bacterium]